jgi:hypothetical protein
MYLNGSFRTWRYIASFDQLVLFEYSKCLALVFINVEYCELIPEIEDPQLLVVSDQNYISQFVLEKDVKTKKGMKLIEMRGKNGVIKIFCSKFGLQNVDLPFTEKEIALVSWNFFD